MKKCIVFLLFALCFTAVAQVNPKESGKKIKKDVKQVEKVAEYTSDLPAYVIYDNKGQKVSYTQMVQALADADVCLFGEQHNDPISHWMELSLVKSLYQLKKDNFITGAEMWESDNQLIMDEMMKSKMIDGKSYTESSKLWPNFTTDYKPILLYAKKNNIPFICTNIPRRYARIVFQKGIEYLDSLGSQAKTYMPPLPIHFDLTQPVYEKMASVFPTDEEFEKEQLEKKEKNEINTKKAGPMTGSKPSNLVKAQAIKDATMAYFILKNWEPGKYFFHFNGEFHSADYTSISYYLKYYNPNVKVITVSVLRQENILDLSNENNHANFNIIVPDDMTVTYVSSSL